MSKDITEYNFPKDLKNMSIKQMDLLSYSIRDFLIENVSSTGGHLSELLQLKPLFEKVDYHIITEKTKSNLALKKKYPSRVNFLIYGTKDHMLTYPIKLFLNCLKSLYFYFKFHPDYIITTGAHTAGPIC